MITLLVLTDGRGECLTRTLASAEEMLPQDTLCDRLIVNDCQDPGYQAWLTETYGLRYRILAPARRKRGFGGAIQAGWDEIEHGDYVFHLEDDFTFRQPVPLRKMAKVLDRHLHLAQISLMRQAWNPDERAAGGLVELHPEWYTESGDQHGRWLEQRAYFTTNPSLYRRSLTKRGWPQKPRSEGLFSLDLIRDGFTMAVWGDGTPWVTHIGDERVGTGY